MPPTLRGLDADIHRTGTGIPITTVSSGARTVLPVATAPSSPTTWVPRFLLGEAAQSAAEDAWRCWPAPTSDRVPRAYLNHLLIRSESISSSWIEGNRISPKRLAIAEAAARRARVSRST